MDCAVIIMKRIWILRCALVVTLVVVVASEYCRHKSDSVDSLLPRSIGPSSSDAARHNIQELERMLKSSDAVKVGDAWELPDKETNPNATSPKLNPARQP